MTEHASTAGDPQPRNTAAAPDPTALRPDRVEGVPLSRLLPDQAPLPGTGGTAGDPRVTGIALNTAALRPGDLYCALPGAKTHGALHAARAVEAGACAVLTDSEGAASLGDCPAPVFVAEDPRALAASLASRVYGTDRRLPSLFGVTGTNGKTTTTYFLRALLTALGHTSGLVGTIEIVAGEEPIPSVLTTPEAPDLHALMAKMVEKGITAAAMEVSSHALEFARVDGLTFDVAGFTNLTQDHLDLHGSMEEYFAVKARLFTPERARKGVAVVDGPWGRELRERAGIPMTTLAVERRDPDADWNVVEVHRSGVGHAFTLEHRDGERLDVKVGLPGMFNVANAALAVVMARVSGVPAAQLQRALDAGEPFFTEVPGRMQVIGRRPAAVVDFAHNTEALALAMDAVRPDPAGGGRLIVVFGATGERDTTKRSAMGRVAVEGADVVVVTDDDPHGEEPSGIRDQVCAGAREALGDRPAVQLLNVAPRAEAIRRAVLLARDGDAILVAGRGHEAWQEVQGVNLPLDDREELRAALHSRSSPQAGGVG